MNITGLSSACRSVQLASAGDVNITGLSSICRSVQHASTPRSTSNKTEQAAHALSKCRPIVQQSQKQIGKSPVSLMEQLRGEAQLREQAIAELHQLIVSEAQKLREEMSQQSKLRTDLEDRFTRLAQALTFEAQPGVMTQKTTAPSQGPPSVANDKCAWLPKDLDPQLPTFGHVQDDVSDNEVPMDVVKQEINDSKAFETTTGRQSNCSSRPATTAPSDDLPIPEFHESCPSTFHLTDQAMAQECHAGHVDEDPAAMSPGDGFGKLQQRLMHFQQSCERRIATYLSELRTCLCADLEGHFKETARELASLFKSSIDANKKEIRETLDMHQKLLRDELGSNVKVCEESIASATRRIQSLESSLREGVLSQTDELVAHFDATVPKQLSACFDHVADRESHTSEVQFASVEEVHSMRQQLERTVQQLDGRQVLFDRTLQTHADRQARLFEDLAELGRQYSQTSMRDALMRNGEHISGLRQRIAWQPGHNDVVGGGPRLG